MKKVIAVDERFRDLKEQLKAKGYEVVDLYQRNVPIDVCIYYDNMKGFQNINPHTGMGVLMINGKGKSIADIEFMIKKGVYSSLF